MDANAFVDLLLQSGKDLAKKGQVLAEQKLDLPAEGPERERMLKNLGTGAAAGGVLALLLGTNVGRNVTGSALKLGSLAALGALGYEAFQKWQGRTAGAGASAGQLTGSAATVRSLALLKAMVAAAKADGHIDDTERARIEDKLRMLELDSETVEFFKAELAKPLDVKDIAAAADSPEAATEIYLTSLLIVDAQNAAERAYLDSLASELHLAPELVATLETQAKS